MNCLRPEAVAVEELLPRAPTDLVRVVSRALVKDREQRFGSIDEMRHALRAAHTSAMSGVIPPTITAPDAPTTSLVLESVPAARPVTREAPAASTPAKPRKLRWALAFAVAAATVVVMLMSLPALRGRAGTAAGRTPSESNKSSYQHYVAGQGLLKRHDRRADLDRAIVEFTQAIEKDPDYAPGYAGLADAYYWKNALNTDAQWKRLAMESATQAVRLNLDLGIAHTAMGRALMIEGRSDEAEGHLKEALEQDPGQAAALMSLAAIAAERKDLATAEARYRRAAAAAPQDWEPLAELGQLLYKSARLSGSGRCLGTIGQARRRQRVAPSPTRGRVPHAWQPRGCGQGLSTVPADRANRERLQQSHGRGCQLKSSCSNVLQPSRLGLASCEQSMRKRTNRTVTTTNDPGVVVPRPAGSYDDR